MHGQRLSFEGTQSPCPRRSSAAKSLRKSEVLRNQSPWTLWGRLGDRGLVLLSAEFNMGHWVLDNDRWPGLLCCVCVHGVGCVDPEIGWDAPTGTSLKFLRSDRMRRWACGIHFDIDILIMDYVVTWDRWFLWR